jgi:hypothetical protein
MTKLSAFKRLQNCRRPNYPYDEHVDVPVLPSCVKVADCYLPPTRSTWRMIRPQISNAVVMSLLFASLAGGAMLLVAGPPALRQAAAAVQKCEFGATLVSPLR